MLNQQALARPYCLRQRASLKRAEKLLDGLLASLEALPNAGQIHRAVVLQTSAELCWRQGNLTGWQELRTHLLSLTQEAGLLHFYNRLLRIYGEQEVL